MIAGLDVLQAVVGLLVNRMIAGLDVLQAVVGLPITA
jgi:hypothetical protein